MVGYYHRQFLRDFTFPVKMGANIARIDIEMVYRMGPRLYIQVTSDIALQKKVIVTAQSLFQKLAFTSAGNIEF
jgi:hypothetical protein